MCQMEMGIYVFVIERTPRAEGNKSSIRVPTEHVGVVVAGGEGHGGHFGADRTWSVSYWCPAATTFT